MFADPFLRNHVSLSGDGMMLQSMARIMSAVGAVMLYDSVMDGFRVNAWGLLSLGDIFLPSLVFDHLDSGSPTLRLWSCFICFLNSSMGVIVAGKCVILTSLPGVVLWFIEPGALSMRPRLDTLSKCQRLV